MSMSDLPSNFVGKMNVMQNYNKAPIRILPTSGSSPVREGGYIKIALPPGCVLDLRTLNITFWARTLVNGTTSTTKLVGLPKWTSSLIQDLDIWVNGRSVQKFPYYGFVYSLLQDYKSNYSAKCKEIGINADPSVFTHMDNSGAIVKWNTYTAHGSSAEINGFQNFYCWNDFIGFLGTCQPSIIDTNLLGSVELHIRLAPGSVLFTSANIGTDTPGFELSNIVAYIDKLDFKDDRYYSMMNSILNSQTRLRIPYKNYGVYIGDAISGTATNNAKNCTMKITESCESLDKIIFTFMDNTAPNGKQPLQLGDTNAILSTTALTASGAYAQADITAIVGRLANISSGHTAPALFNYTNLLANNDDKLLNTSVAFKRNGLGMGAALGSQTTGTVQFQINSQDITHPLSLIEQHQQTLQAFELNEDDQKQINPCIKNLALYERDFYACALSTQHINNKDSSYTLVSGLDTQATSMNISVKVSSTRDGHATAQAALPVIITEMTSHLVVAPGRQILPVK